MRRLATVVLRRVRARWGAGARCYVEVTRNAHALRRGNPDPRRSTGKAAPSTLQAAARLLLYERAARCGGSEQWRTLEQYFRRRSLPLRWPAPGLAEVAMVAETRAVVAALPRVVPAPSEEPGPREELALPVAAARRGRTIAVKPMGRKAVVIPRSRNVYASKNLNAAPLGVKSASTTLRLSADCPAVREGLEVATAAPQRQTIAVRPANRVVARMPVFKRASATA